MSALEPVHLPALLLRRFRATPSLTAYRSRVGSAWTSVSFGDVDIASAELAHGLIASGLAPGDRVAIMAPTDLPWILAMFAVWRAGGVVTTIYPSSTKEDCDHILTDAGCTFALIHDHTYADRLPSDWPGTCIAMSGANTTAWHGLRSRGAARLRSGVPLPHSVDANDVAALIYTSGTTGRPKGVMLTHDNFVAVCVATAGQMPLQPGDEQFLFLPLSHVYGMVVALVAFHVGVPTALDGDVQRIGDGLQQLHPTFLPAVPRVFEKIHERALAKAVAAGPRKQRVFTWALNVGVQWSQTVRAGQAVPRSLAVKRAVADRLVFSKVRHGLGGRLRAVSSGGAPLAPELAAFFHAVGIPLMEGYGLTESTGVSLANRLDHWKAGTVGLPGEGLEVRLADDGEILLRGRSIMKGYHNLPETTAEVIVDGWLHTGDIGERDDDGFIRITDRKKHLIITAGGKNIAPAPIENQLKMACPLLGEAMLLGDRRKYCVAVLALDPESLHAHGLRDTVEPDGSWPPDVVQRVQEAVDAVNAGLASYQTVKRFVLVPEAPTVEAGTLTASLKLRRKAFAAQYAEQIEALYS